MLKKFLHRMLLVERHVNQKNTLEYWQQSSYQIILAAVLIASLPSLLKSGMVSLSEGMWAGLLFHACSYATCLALFFIHSISYKIRAWLGMIILFLLGVIAFLFIGPVGNGRVYFFTAAIITTLILGLRSGLLMLLLQSVFLFIFYFLIDHGAVKTEGFIEYNQDVWVATSLTLVFLVLISIIAVGRLIKGITQSLDEAEKLSSQHRETAQKLEHQIKQHDFTIQSLIESEERWHFALEGSGDGVWDWDLESGTFSFSKQWCRVFGYVDHEPENNINSWFDLILSKDREQFDTELEAFLNGQKTFFIHQHRIRYQDKETHWVLARGKVIATNSKGKPARVIGTHTDITGIKVMEEKQAEYEKRLQQTQKMEAIGTLAGGIAHDFNNILFPILGYSELLKKTLTNPANLQSVEQIYKSGQRAKQLVQQILTFSRQEETRYVLVEIQIILKETIKMCRSVVPKYIEIRHEIDSECHKVKADPTQLHQIIMNLITNAYQSIGQRAGYIKIQLSNHQMSQEEAEKLSVQAGHYVQFIVEDSGSGIAEKDLDKIFEPFFTTKGKGKGTGLGLALVHGIMQKMNGAIEVSSVLGKGTVFKLYFKAIDRVLENQDEPNLPEDQVVRGCEHILLIDDEPAILKVEEQALRSLGYEVTAVTLPTRALELFSQDPAKYDLIVTDMDMPKISGLELTRQVLSIKPDMPILVCTGYSESCNLKKAEQLGINDILFKPVALSYLANRIRKALDSIV
ncbi:MAG: hypothetical protein CR997_09460 [Acidobacteria bacterium]|nr:MAG: hypothetical protein CR997_09460 [Acidobacteriota bacterium]